MKPDALVAAIASGAPQAAEQQLLDIDGTVFVMLGVFLVMLALLKPLLWGPYLRVRAERETRTDGFKADAARMSKEADDKLHKVEASIAEVRKEGLQAFAKTRKEAEAHEQALVAKARDTATEALKAARADLAKAMDRERETLKARSEALGSEAAAQILGRDLGRDLGRKLERTPS